MNDAFRIAFSTYSSIPVRCDNWTKEGREYSLCFLPLIGAVIGAAECLIGLLLYGLQCGPILRGCIFTAVPILLTGGIHFDGFMDSCDAIHSFADRSKKLEILADPHVGAFAVMGAILYISISIGAWSEMKPSAMPMIVLVFLFSRALSALAALSFPKAKKDGMLASMTEGASQRALGIVGVEVLGLAAGIILVGLLCGHFLFALLLLLLSAAVYVVYYYIMLLQFGGTTGDLAGWFLQIMELVCLLLAALLY